MKILPWFRSFRDFQWVYVLYRLEESHNKHRKKSARRDMATIVKMRHWRTHPCWEAQGIWIWAADLASFWWTNPHLKGRCIGRSMWNIMQKLSVEAKWPGNRSKFGPFGALKPQGTWKQVLDYIWYIPMDHPGSGAWNALRLRVQFGGQFVSSNRRHLGSIGMAHSVPQERKRFSRRVCEENKYTLLQTNAVMGTKYPDWSSNMVICHFYVSLPRGCLSCGQRARSEIETRYGGPSFAFLLSQGPKKSAESYVICLVGKPLGTTLVLNSVGFWVGHFSPQNISEFWM